MMHVPPQNRTVSDYVQRNRRAFHQPSISEAQDFSVMPRSGVEGMKLRLQYDSESPDLLGDCKICLEYPCISKY